MASDPRPDAAETGDLNLPASLLRLQVIGIVVVMALVGGVGGWAATTEISGAVLAPGSLVVDGESKTVQHLTGGVVGEILANNGDVVKPGDVLVRLDATVTKANLAIVVKRLDEFYARRARLAAERDGAEAISFPDSLTSRASDPSVAEVMAGETSLFKLRRGARLGQKRQLGEREAQIRKIIEGLNVQASAKAKEIELIQRELKGARTLWKKGLMPITKFTQLQREATRTEGEHGNLLAAIARSESQIGETQLQIIQIDRELASEVATELRDIDARIGEFVERKVKAEDELRRIDIRAPIAGVIHHSVVNTVGGVIGAGDVLMRIVPVSEDLKVEARVAVTDIDQVKMAQTASMRFSAFNQSTTPEIEGVVEQVAPDSTEDNRTGQIFYKVRIQIGEDQLSKLSGLKLIPGMPVETFIKTGDRVVASYLARPLTDQFKRAFRED